MNKVIAIVGPTASGKTKLAIDLAKTIDGEIISADSRLVYKGFDIATAKPTQEEQSEVKHHLIDIVEPEYDFSVSDFVTLATEKIEELHAVGKTPIVVGGTGLYFRILLEDYAPPKVEANLKLRAELEAREIDDLYNELVLLDKKASEQIHFNNKVRIVRALEVIKTLGIPFSEAKGLKDKTEMKYDVEWVFPEVNSREQLYNRINLRVDQMVTDGLIEETKLLLNKHGKIKNLVNTIGYKEIISYLDGHTTLNESLDLLKQNTRRYAKRQLTWFRKNPELSVDI